jgi:hypothetical protein
MSLPLMAANTTPAAGATSSPHPAKPAGGSPLTTLLGMMPISSMEEFNRERWNQLGFLIAVFIIWWILKMVAKIGEHYID